MIKILIFNRSFFGGGVEKALLDIIKKLDKELFDVTVMVRRKDGAYKDAYQALESEHIHIRACFDYLKPGVHFWEKIRNVFLIRLADAAIYNFPKLYYRIAIRDKFDIEVAFMHNEATSVIASSSNKKSRKIAWIHTDLSQLTSWKYYFKTRARQKKYYSKFDRIICVSNLVEKRAKQLLNISNTTVILNPVDRERIIELAKQPVEIPVKEGKCICAVGRLSPEKNFEMLIRAHAKIISKGIKHNLWIIGDGPSRASLEKLIVELGVEDTVTLWGYQVNPYPFVNCADFTVCSSHYEGLHIASMESLILGKPVISCCEVVAELFDGFDCGQIVDNKVDSLADALYQMLTDVSLLDRRTKAAYERGEKGFEDTVRQIEDLFISICKK